VKKIIFVALEKKALLELFEGEPEVTVQSFFSELLHSITKFWNYSNRLLCQCQKNQLVASSKLHIFTRFSATKFGLLLHRAMC
jgi:hypothetical protein